MEKQFYRGYKLLTKVNNLDEFQKKFGIPNKVMRDNYAYGFVENNISDIEVIRRILKKMANGWYLVRYVEVDGEYEDYFLIYSK